MAEIHRVRPDEWREWRTLRLSALAEAPYAFGSTYAREVEHSDEVWQERTSRAAESAENAVFVAVTYTGEWVACAGGLIDEDEPDSVQVISVWTAPGQRGAGLAEVTTRAVLDWASTTTAPDVRLWVTETNEAARRLYERLGFTATGRRQPLPSDPSLTEIELVLPA